MNAKLPIVLLKLFFFQEDLENGEEVATCPSCSLIVKVIYDKVRSTGQYAFIHVYHLGLDMDDTCIFFNQKR